MKRAVFLDRDGVINVDTGYPYKVEDLKIYLDVRPFLDRIWDSDYVPIIISNQSGVGRGLFTNEDLNRFNDEIQIQLGDNLPFYCCLHTPEDKCCCRKPKPGLIHFAAIRHDICLEKSILIGDRHTDTVAGFVAGIPRLYLLTREGPLRNLHIPPGAQEEIRTLDKVSLASREN